MPHAAIADGSVDGIFPPEELAKELERLSKSKYILSKSMEKEPLAEVEIDDENGEEDAINIKTEEIDTILRLSS